VFIRSVTLQNFRNHARTQLNFAPGINMIIGDNAQGKTNLLEALYMTCVGRGFRGPRDRDVIKFGSDFARVKTVAARKFGDISVDVIISSTPGRAGKQIKINGVPIAKMGELMGSVTCVFFCPDELKLIKESPADRRRFMDIGISQMDKVYFYNLLRYDKILKHRNALLKTMGTTQQELRALDIWDEQLAALATQIISKRVFFCEQLAQEAAAVHKILAPGEQISVQYETYTPIENIDISSSALPHSISTRSVPCGTILDVLRNARDKDLHLKSTTVGPHRDDIAITVNGKDVRSFASQGQQRTAALSLKIAELKIFERVTGEKPILLLDDVLSELDKNRRTKLLTMIDDWQSVITATDFNLAADIRVKTFRVKNGVVSV
jgi:DNA replication and repair protein RecF